VIETLLLARCICNLRGGQDFLLGAELVGFDGEARLAGATREGNEGHPQLAEFKAIFQNPDKVTRKLNPQNGWLLVDVRGRKSPFILPQIMIPGRIPKALQGTACRGANRQILRPDHALLQALIAPHSRSVVTQPQLKIGSSIPGLAAGSDAVEPVYPLVGACMNPRLRVLASKLERFGKIVNKLALLTPNHEPKVAPN
jgi:hypothetical protein